MPDNDPRDVFFYLILRSMIDPYIISSVPSPSLTLMQIKKYKKNVRSVYSAKTYLYIFDPFKPYFYIVKLGFTGVYIIFLISAQNIDCGYSLEPPRRKHRLWVLVRTASARRF